MTCRVAWSDPHGEHQCRHDEGHETRRHGCVCGSYANDRTSTPRNDRPAPSLGHVGDRSGRGGAASPRTVSTATT